MPPWIYLVLVPLALLVSLVSLGYIAYCIERDDPHLLASLRRLCAAITHRRQPR